MATRAALPTAVVAVLISVSFAGCFGPTELQRTSWAFDAVQLTALISQGRMGDGIAVAVLDSGVDLSGPYMGGVVLAHWEDLVNNRADPYDDNGHGTAMASILVGRGALAGAAPSVDLIVIKVIAGDGTGSDATVATGISHAVSAGADIISLSLGGGSLPILGSASTQAADAALAAGVFIVASAGNDGGAGDDGQVAAPGVSRDAISVGAVDMNNVIAPFSSKGRSGILTSDPDRKPEVVAPGVAINVAWTGGGAMTVSGTSPAAVFVSAGLALILQQNTHLVRQGTAAIGQVKQAIMDSARAVGGQHTPHDDYYGYGLFQAAAADALL